MTRKAGFVPVKLSGSRANAIADWLGTLDVNFPGPSLIETAGLTAADIQARKDEKQALLGSLCACLRPRTRGRPRAAASYYMVPRDALSLIDRRYFLRMAPRELRRPFLELIKAGKRKKGPKVPQHVRQANIGNEKYQDETIRVYKWQDRKKQEREKLDALTLAAMKNANFPSLLEADLTPDDLERLALEASEQPPRTGLPMGWFAVPAWRRR